MQRCRLYDTLTYEKGYHCFLAPLIIPWCDFTCFYIVRLVNHEENLINVFKYVSLFVPISHLLFSPFLGEYCFVTFTTC